MLSSMPPWVEECRMTGAMQSLEKLTVARLASSAADGMAEGLIAPRLTKPVVRASKLTSPDVLDVLHSLVSTEKLLLPVEVVNLCRRYLLAALK